MSGFCDTICVRTCFIVQKGTAVRQCRILKMDGSVYVVSASGLLIDYDFLDRSLRKRRVSTAVGLRDPRQGRCYVSKHSMYRVVVTLCYGRDFIQYINKPGGSQCGSCLPRYEHCPRQKNVAKSGQSVWRLTWRLTGLVHRATNIVCVKIMSRKADN